MENFLSKDFSVLLGGFPFAEGHDRVSILRMPGFGGDGYMQFLSVQRDYGDIVHGVFLDPESMNGKHVQAISELATLNMVVQAFSNGML